MKLPWLTCCLAAFTVCVSVSAAEDICEDVIVEVTQPLLAPYRRPLLSISGARAHAVRAELRRGSDAQPLWTAAWDATAPPARLAVVDPRQAPEGALRLSVEVRHPAGRAPRICDEREIRVRPGLEEEDLGAHRLHAADGEVRLVDDTGRTLAAVEFTSGNDRHDDVWRSGTGPIPPAEYYFGLDDVQAPRWTPGGARYPSGDAVDVWGPYRIHLHPDPVLTRDALFIHQPLQGPTQGCVGIRSADWGLMNWIVARLRARPDRSFVLSVKESLPASRMAAHSAQGVWRRTGTSRP